VVAAELAHAEADLAKKRKREDGEREREASKVRRPATHEVRFTWLTRTDEDCRAPTCTDTRGRPTQLGRACTECPEPTM